MRRINNRVSFQLYDDGPVVFLPELLWPAGPVAAGQSAPSDC